MEIKNKIKQNNRRFWGINGLPLVLFLLFSLTLASFWQVEAKKDKDKDKSQTEEVSEDDENKKDEEKTEEEKQQEKEEKEKEEKKRKEKEEKLEKLKKKKEEIEKKKEKDLKVKWQISSEIGSIDNNISEIKSDLDKTSSQIERVQEEVENSEKIIAEKHDLMAQSIRKIDRMRLEGSLIALSEENGLNDYFFTVDTLEMLEEELYGLIEEAKQNKQKNEDKKKEFHQVMEIQADQKSTLEVEKNKKNYLLNKKQADINEKDAKIANLQAKLNKLQSELSSLLGKSYNFSEIESAVKFASKKTGVRKDFLMGMLVVESDLGRFTGGCNYKQSRMSKSRQKAFKKICKDLGYDYKKKKVSCPPRNYRGTGGAMGVQQFMSDTWLAYEKRIASLTGNHPPDPWSLTDGVMAMALKLAQDGGASKSGECRASKRYLGGSHQWYCDKVQYWAKHYEKKL